jgi:TldD protein
MIDPVKYVKQAKTNFPHTTFVFRYQDSPSILVSYVDDVLDQTVQSDDPGIGIHAFNKKGHMGFASTNILNKSHVKETFENAYNNMKIAQKNNFETMPGIHKVEPVKDTIIYDKNCQLPEPEHIKPHIKEIYSRLKSIELPKELKVSFNHGFACTVETRRIVRTDGTDVVYSYPFSRYTVVISATKKGQTKTFLVNTRGNLLELFNVEPVNQLLNEAASAIELLNDLFKAPKIKPGSYNLLVDGKVGSVFVHEAFGHTAEVDSIRNGCPISKDDTIDKGRKVAERFVSIYEETLKFDRAYTPYSEYGVKRQKTEIVKQGKLNDFLSDISHYDKDPLGNSRAETYHDPKVDGINEIYQYLIKHDIISKRKKYVFLSGNSGGNVSPLEGTFQFNSLATYTLHNGKVKLYQGSSFSGKTLNVLSSISGGSKQMDVFIGVCGKDGQNIPDISHAPALTIFEKNKEVKIA